MIEEFKKFIERGNVFEMAIGIIIGIAVGNIVNSMVNDILMPFLGIFIGGVDFTNLTIKIGDAVISYGQFIQSVVNFLIISFCIFMIIKFINKLMGKEEEKKEEVKKPEVPEDVKLLKEIRDLLKKKK